MKDPCITREQSIGIDDVVDDQGFAMHHRAILYTVSHSDGLTSFLMSNV